MSKSPLVVNESMPASKALAIMSEKKITSLLVVSDKDTKKINKKLKGIIHIHFLLKNGIKFSSTKISGKWCEIDTPEDLENAKELFKN